MNRHINLMEVHNRFPYLKTHKSNGKLYIGIDVAKTGLELNHDNIIYVIGKVYDYLIHYCWDGRVYNIKKRNHMIVISSKF